jgi:signal transduction histidine kinase
MPSLASPDSRGRSLAPSSDEAERARALLAATNAFLVCKDVDAVGHAIAVAIDAMFAPDRTGVTIADSDGTLRLAAAIGYSHEEQLRVRDALAARQGSVRRVLDGEALWSDDPENEAYRALIRAYGARDGFSLPIATTAGVVGTCTASYLEPRTFDAGFRSAALNLANQAGLAASLILRVDAVGELDRQRRRSDTLLELSSALAGTQDRVEVERLVCTLVRQASRAPFAMVGRRDDETDRFIVVATDGLEADQVARIEAAMRATDRPSLQQLLGGGLVRRSGEQAVGRGIGIGEAMGAPIVVVGRTVGFLAIGAPGGETVSPEEWQELLTAFATVAATALARVAAVGELALQRDTLASEVEERTRSLRAAIDELRLASDAKTDFLANVSHELRTPLTAILGFVEILASGMDGPVNADQARDLETVRVSSHHLLELIDDLIDIASIESGRIQLQVGPVAAEDVVRDALETIRPLAVAKGIALEIATLPAAPGGQPILVAADRGRLREIVLNLLSNAVKFTEPPGRVVVGIAIENDEGAGSGAGEVGAGAGEAGARRPTAAISVRDTGTGIAPGDLERIFEKFVRIATAATPGTGLGLPISRELARLHGGDVVVESTPGHGSTFTVRIPLAAG